MADLGASSWSEIDASNDAVPPSGWPEGMAPSDVNNSARSQMGGEKRWWDRSNATQTTTGTSTAYVLTYAATESALYDGEETSFVVHISSGATPTLNRDGLGAKFLRKFDFATNAFISVGALDLRTNQVARVRYNLSADRYDIIATSISPGAFVQTTSNNVFTGTNTFDNTVTMLTAAFNEAVRVDVASAPTTDLGAILSNYARITGAITITSLGTIASGARRHVVFAGSLTLTHNATSLILPNNGNNINTLAGDCALFLSEGSGNWRCLDYHRANGQALATIITFITASLGADVNLNNTANYFDGPSIAQGTSGTWQVSGNITVYDATTGNAQIYYKLWDGTTVIDSGSFATNVGGGGVAETRTLSGVITSPAGNLRISCRDASTINGKILFNQSGNSKDSTITAVRIA